MNPQQVNHSRSISSGSFTAPTQDFSVKAEDQSSPLPTSLGLGNPLNSQLNQSFDSSFFASPSNPMAGQAPVDSTISFTQASQTHTFSAADYTDPDFSLFPAGVAQADTTFDQPLFEQSLAAGVTSPQMNPSSPTTANLLKPEGHASPAMLQNQFSSPPASHSRNASLGPADALFPGQADWSRVAAFQGHRRTPSEYSDVSSVAHSPLLPLESSFENTLEHGGHSPMHSTIDMPGMYGDMDVRISNLNFSDPQHSPGIMAGRSPSHSPAISPRLMPVPSSADLHSPANFGMLASTSAYQQPFTPLATAEAFPTLSNQAVDMPQMAPPAINIQLAPAPKPFEGSKTMNSASLTPPERGRTRPRSVTDPYNAQMRSGNSLSPNIAASMSRDASRSASPGSRASSVASNRRRQSTSSVPNNVIALRLADPEYHPPENGNTRRVQKHPATFQCTLCPKRFTRAYNLRSHLRTHTDERPFVCTVCGKAFARQHDRKRHESLHSGEKKFVCKGELKTGGTWGCSRRFARADALGRHFRSEAGRVCIKPLLDEEAMERQRVWQEQQMAQNISQNMGQPPQMLGPDGYPIDATGGYAFPQALLAQYPALAQMSWSQPGPTIEDDLSGRSSFEASDYEEAEDGGYVSGPGTGFGDGNVANGFGDLSYASDYGQGDPTQ